jgi:hypothetical protein
MSFVEGYGSALAIRPKERVLIRKTRIWEASPWKDIKAMTDKVYIIQSL